MASAYHRSTGTQYPEFLGVSDAEALPLRRLRRRMPRADLHAVAPESLRVDAGHGPATLAEVHSTWPLLPHVPAETCARGYGQRAGHVWYSRFSPRLVSFPSLCTRAVPNLSQGSGRASQPPTPQPGLARSPCFFSPSVRALHAESAPGCGAVEACRAEAASRRDLPDGSASEASLLLVNKQTTGHE